MFIILYMLDMAMPMVEPKKDEKITVSFNLSLEQYRALEKRLPNFGDKTMFFRTVVDKFLRGELEVTTERKF